MTVRTSLPASAVIAQYIRELAAQATATTDSKRS